MIIKDINGYTKNAKTIQQINFDRKNECIVFKSENRDGELIKVGEQQLVESVEKYIVVDIIGKTGREWKEYYPLHDFERLNPGVEYGT